jgi:hypothetical protein
MTIATNPGTELQTIDDEDGREVVEVQPMAAALAKADVEAQIDVAHKYPRSVSRFRKAAVEMATITEEVAQSCIYSLPRGGKPITGPSVRLAEICASAWGNLHMGSRVVGSDDKEIAAQGAVWDLERNTRVTIEVRRRITDKNGNRFKDDMVVVTGNAAVSIALRNAIFRVIPKAYVDVIYDVVRKVAVGDAMTLAQRRAEFFLRLGKYGADEKRILATLGRAAIEDVTLDDLEVLIGFGTAIKNGEKTVDECFPPMAPVPGSGAPEGTRVKLGKAAEPTPPANTAQPTAAASGPVPPVATQATTTVVASGTEGAKVAAELAGDKPAEDKGDAPTAAEIEAHEKAEREKAAAPKKGGK